ncbi:MAG: DNA mismatch repair protein, partial [Muribaculaceae bacterium]|nr:DNA mismatch repair protein [Muribaculaceae bacterium]
DSVEYWYGVTDVAAPVSVTTNLFSCLLRQLLSSDDSYTKYVHGLESALKVVTATADFLGKFPEKDCPVRDLICRFHECFSTDNLKKIADMSTRELSDLRSQLAADLQLRSTCRGGVSTMLNLLYELDFSLSVAQVATERGFSYPTACDKTSDGNFLDIKGLWHPSLVKAIANDIRIDYDKNVYFLTGVNMAGKSTFMKAVATSAYLAHIGFPVPARKLEFTPLDGIYTSINVPDNIAMGYSHFYAEVLRVKSIAQKVQEGKNLLIIFDELFKGTNVKDAFDATLAVTEAFASHRNCLYIVSTHIVESGEALAQRCSNIQFHRLPTRVDDGRLVYTYLLEDGISPDRHGMTIIRNEGILEAIREAASNK